jgi:hypothetical protein
MGIVTALSCPVWCFDCMYFCFGLYNTMIWAEYGTGLSVATGERSARGDRASEVTNRIAMASVNSLGEKAHPGGKGKM